MGAATSRSAAAATVGGPWTGINPGSAATGQIPGGGAVSGRAYSVVADPADATNNTLYVATGFGGAWKTTNKGASWTPLTDQQASLATTVVVLDPTNTQHVYVGTGDPTPSNFAYGANSYFGEGILFSANGGTTWSTLGDDPAHFQGSAIYDMTIDSTGTALYVAASNGFWIGALSAGVWTFSQKAAGTWTSVRINPGNTDIINLGASGGSMGGPWLYHVIAGTLTASKLCLTAFPSTVCTTFTPASQVGRTTVAESPVLAHAVNVYASVQCLTSAGACPKSNQIAWWGLYQSNDSGLTFHILQRGQDAWTTAAEFSQASYGLPLGLDPRNENYVYFGAADLLRYSSLINAPINVSSPPPSPPPPAALPLLTCSAWGTGRFALQNGIHCGQHGISSDAAGNVYIATDGGVFATPPDSLGAQWNNLNSNLYTSQFYPGISYNTNNPNRIIGGTANNGTQTSDGAAWQVTQLGDGGFTAIDPGDPTNTWYASTPYLNIYKTVNGSTPWSSGGGPTWTLSTTGMIADPTDATRVKGALFIAPFTMDSSNHLNLLAGGDRPYVTINGAGNWQDASGNFTPITATNQGISATGICSVGGNFYLGTSDGRAFTTNNGYNASPTWSEVSTGLPGQWVTRVACALDGTAYLTVGGSTTVAGTHVFRKAPADAGWTSIQGDLPNTTVTSIAIDPRTNPATLYVSTDLGVYQSTNTGTNWQPYGTAIPKAPVVDLALDPARTKLLAATHGRGVWQVALATTPSAPAGAAAVAGNASASVSWTAPASDGGSPVTGNRVTPYIGATAQTPAIFNSTATTQTVTGLTNGTNYTFRVAAINPYGTGPDSASSNAVTPLPPPSSAASTQQYILSNSDGVTWRDIDPTNLTLAVTPTFNAVAILSGNADLWTATPGYNQDIGIDVNGTIAAWKESGGFAGTFSPNAAMVQAVYTMNMGITYTLKLRWKTNKPASGVSIYAGAGPVGGLFSPTRLTVELLPAGPNPYTAVSTQQYSLANNDGSTWSDMDPTNLKVTFTPSSNGYAILSGNADLWTANAGYNQDLALDVNGTLAAWKESGGFAGTFSPNAALVQAVIPVSTGVTYTAKLRWKTNKPAAGATIYAGAGPIAAQFSPTRLTVQLQVSPAPMNAASTRQYSLAGNDGSTWVDMDSTSATPLVLTITPSVNSMAILAANADLWTATAGYNQDIAIDVNGTIVAWKESGGFAGTFSPNAAAVQTVFPMTAGTTYTVKIRWKANKAASGATIYGGAGPIGGQYSPTVLIALPIPS